MAEFKIYDVNMEALEAKLAKLNKKAVKLNCEPFALNVISTETIRNEELKTENKVYTLELSGTPPQKLIQKTTEHTAIIVNTVILLEKGKCYI